MALLHENGIDTKIECGYEFNYTDHKAIANVAYNRMISDPSYKQVLQITIPYDRNCLEDYTPCVVVDKSVDKNEFYIYIPPNGNEYIFQIDPELTFQNLLDHILYSTEEFSEYYKQGTRFEFVLEELFHCNEQYTSESFLKIPLDKIPIAQGSIVAKKEKKPNYSIKSNL